MGIQFSKNIDYISNDTFHKTDYKVMGLAYDIHNEIGRFFNEKVYQNYLAHLCLKAGIHVDTEIPITVSFKDFRKTFYIDLIVNNSIIYELKSTCLLINEHSRQALNYLMLTGSNYGKLLNFGTESVEYKFITTSLCSEDRYDINIIQSKWIEIDKDSKWLKDVLVQLLNEWGGFLDIQLYYDAICFFKGGKENTYREIEIYYNDNIITTQKFYLLNNSTAFRLSGITKNKQSYRTQLEKLLVYSSINTIQWINFNHHNIEFETILK